MDRLLRILFILFTTLSVQAEVSAADDIDIDIYGHLPTLRSMAISPSGERLAWIQEGDGIQPSVIVYDMKSGKSVGGVRLTGDMKARGIIFASENYIIIKASDTRTVWGTFTRIEESNAFVYRIDAERTYQLLRKTKNLHPAQEGKGRITGVIPAEDYVLMPAFGSGRHPSYNLYKVSLSNGRGVIYKPGNTNTIDWFSDDKGKVLAREDFDAEAEMHRIYSFSSGNEKLIYEVKTNLPAISVQAVSWDQSSLLFTEKSDNSEAVYSLSLTDGSVQGPVFSYPDKDIDRLLTDNNRRLIAVRYSGFTPGYEFSSNRLNDAFRKLTENYPASSIDLIDRGMDENQYLVRISGNAYANAYMLFSVDSSSVSFLIQEYPELEPEKIAEIIGFRYPNRDGIKIPAILTWPKPDNIRRSDLPLIVIPHGGPDTYDDVRFDWMAQYLASQGYLILQPNYRGSTGFGPAYHSSGYGRWGQEMQDDISDGVSYLTSKGIADPGRVCILGASYGGYAALAGASLTPDLYRCVIAINGISDVATMVKNDIKRAHPDDKQHVKNRLENMFGDLDDSEKFRAISPLHHAEKINAPVLLIASEDDTIVDGDQSEEMLEALRRHKKTVHFTRLDDDDHWLSTSPMRLKTLHEISRFLQQYNPVNAEQSSQVSQQ